MKPNSLIFKLLGAFLLVIAIFALIISAATSLATRSAFDIYTTRSGQVWAARLAPLLAAYYTQTGDWTGVDAYLADILAGEITSTGGMMGQGQGQGQGQDQGRGTGNAMNLMMGLLDQRLILADQDGRVISDTAGVGAGNTLTASDLRNGTVIESGGQFLGTILVTPQLLSADSPAAEFLKSVNRGIVTSVGVAALVALLLGTLLFTQIAAPLQRLKTAANEIAQGNLDHHIDIQTQDEFGELAQSFNQMASALARLETQRQQMVSDVAHELRTPLAAIQCILEGVEDGVLPMDAEQIAALQAETTLLNRLVGDLRVLSLVDAGQLKLEKTRTNPADFLHATVERLRIQAEQKDILLDFEAQDGLPDVFLDQDRIAQVIVNLISNALRYTPNGGRILVKLMSGTDSTLNVSVTDSGVGIEAQALPYVFERFFRADKSRTRASGGSGLGLAIVKQLVEAHGGRVTAESPVFASPDGGGYGTRVSFYLPLYSDAKANIPTSPRRSLTNPKRW